MFSIPREQTPPGTNTDHWASTPPGMYTDCRGTQATRLDQRKKVSPEDHLDLPADLAPSYTYEFALKLSSCRVSTIHSRFKCTRDILFTYSHERIRSGLLILHAGSGR